MEELIGYSMLLVDSYSTLGHHSSDFITSQYEWQSCMQFDPRGEKS